MSTPPWNECFEAIDRLLAAATAMQFTNTVLPERIQEAQAALDVIRRASGVSTHEPEALPNSAWMALVEERLDAIVKDVKALQEQAMRAAAANSPIGQTFSIVHNSDGTTPRLQKAPTPILRSPPKPKHDPMCDGIEHVCSDCMSTAYGRGLPTAKPNEPLERYALRRAIAEAVVSGEWHHQQPNAVDAAIDKLMRMVACHFATPLPGGWTHTQGMRFEIEHVEGTETWRVRLSHGRVMCRHTTDGGITWKECDPPQIAAFYLLNLAMSHGQVLGRG